MLRNILKNIRHLGKKYPSILILLAAYTFSTTMDLIKMHGNVYPRVLPWLAMLFIYYFAFKDLVKE